MRIGVLFFFSKNEVRILGHFGQFSFVMRDGFLPEILI